MDAIEFSPECPQAAPAPFSVIPAPSGSEDCLFLNVYAPRRKEKPKLPVLVWVHGGGYGFGNGQQDMSEIINDNGDSFIALGSFGFLSSTEIQQDGALNAGILDMAFALQCVQDHIGEFGGDKSRVTVAGQSAGAGGVMLLDIAKNGTLGTSLFSNIIAASPYLPPQHNFNAPAPKRQYESFATRTGCANSTDTLSCLRSKDSLTLQIANSDVNTANFHGHWAFAPVKEPESGFISTHPSNALTAGLVNGEHILVGNNANEGPLFVATIDSTKAPQTWLQDAFPSVASTDLESILAVYPPSNMTNNDTFATTGLGPVTAMDTSSFASGIQQRAYNIYAEATFVCPSYWLSGAFTTNNRTAFHYQYSVPGALHGSDVTAYFGPATPSQPRSLTTVFRQIWGYFVTAANPAIAKDLTNLTRPTWAKDEHSKMLNLNITGGVPYSASQLTGTTITEYTDPGLQNDLTVVHALKWESNRGARCEFWRSIATREVERS
ncbi:hypothetical protein AG0111_0g11209 [Alternaria gaisen]|uniref:Uncharacterized protein n=1 Tax=Alternaria gaisen TaxID=167740 RepID=A0ACB6F7X9_9PLEO|nr:hypothetical protein AG0111_0g11209 [Alternaria gaisen]